MTRLIFFVFILLSFHTSAENIEGKWKFDNIFHEMRCNSSIKQRLAEPRGGGTMRIILVVAPEHLLSLFVNSQANWLCGVLVCQMLCSLFSTVVTIVRYPCLLTLFRCKYHIWAKDTFWYEYLRNDLNNPVATGQIFVQYACLGTGYVVYHQGGFVLLNEQILALQKRVCCRLAN